MSEILTAAHKIRETSTPSACASCGGQYPDRRHVDFSAAYDGHVLNQEEVIATGVTPVQVDDLILCDECVTAAAKVLGLEDPADTAAANEALVATNEELTERLQGALALIDKLEGAMAAKETLSAQLKPKPRQRKS